MPSFNINGMGRGAGGNGKAAGKIYRFDTENVSTYRDDHNDDRRRCTTGEFGDDVERNLDVFSSPNFDQSRSGSPLPQCHYVKEERPESVRLLRISIVVSSLMMCLLVYTIISKDAAEEKPHDLSMYHDSLMNHYSFKDGGETRASIIPMGTYNYDSNSMERSHDEESVHSIFDSPADILESTIAGVPAPFDASLANINDLPISQGQTPIFWHIPRSGGVTLSTILSECLGLTLASQVGAHGHESETTLNVVTIGSGVKGDVKFVNVDLTTPSGIDKAKSMGLVQSGLADVIVTPLVHAAMDLFDPTVQGRMFTVIRHPVDRAVSEYNYMRTATWDPSYNPSVAGMSLKEYASSAMMEDNWMVRSLTNSFQDIISANALDHAKLILEKKCLVGLMDNYRSSVHRVIKYFGWDMSILVKFHDSYTCQESLISDGLNIGNSDVTIVEDSEEWDLIVQRNALDMELYSFAQYLYHEQQHLPMFGF